MHIANHRSKRLASLPWGCGCYKKGQALPVAFQWIRVCNGNGNGARQAGHTLKANDMSASNPSRDEVFRALQAKRRETVRRVLRSEIADYLTTVSTSVAESWPDIPPQELTEALADALVDMGRQQGFGTAMLQTLVYELQERVNAET